MPSENTPNVRVCLSNSGQFKKFTTSDFVTKAKMAHGDLYDYSRVVYTGTANKVEIICSVHGSFFQSPNSHLKGEGCKACAFLQKALNQTTTLATFIDKCRSKHKGKYDYKNVSYTTLECPVSIICPLHGTFIQQAYSHMRGAGCPSCSKSGFKTTNPAYLYVLICGDMTKVGITNNSPSERCSRFNTRSGYQFRVLFHSLMRGSEALRAEGIILSHLRQCYENPVRKFEGSTETFIGVDTAGLLLTISDLLKE